MATARARTTPPDVGADHGQVFQTLLLDVVDQNRRGVDIVHRNIEKALDLVGVQIDGENAVDAGGNQHIGHQLGGNRHAGGTRAAVLAGVAEVGDGGGDAAGGCAFERINHGQHFHQVVIGGRAGGLQDEDVAAAHVFQKLDCDFAVGKFVYRSVAQRGVQMFDHAVGQFGIGVAGKHHQIVVCCHVFVT